MLLLTMYYYYFMKVMKEVEEGLYFHAEEGMCYEEATPSKQEILDKIPKGDFLSVKPINYKNKLGDRDDIHKFFIVPRDKIYIFRIANKHTTTKVSFDKMSTTSCMIFDSFLERSNKATKG